MNKPNLAPSFTATASGPVNLAEAQALACTFGFYGLVRKKVDINSLHGLLVETTLLFPLALAVLAFVPARTIPSSTLGILSLSGFITAVPMLMFGAALRRLKLSTIGFLQYIGPTGQLLVALVAFHEPLDRVKLTGGGARNRRWVIAKAALGPGRLEVVRTEEAAALGAALVAGLAGGVYGSVEEALIDASPFDRVTAPATVRARYDAAYLDRWLPAVITRLRQSGLS